LSIIDCGAKTDVFLDARCDSDDDRACNDGILTMSADNCVVLERDIGELLALVPGVLGREAGITFERSFGEIAFRIVVVGVRAVVGEPVGKTRDDRLAAGGDSVALRSFGQTTMF
jgi:hypothetical protein